MNGLHAYWLDPIMVWISGKVLWYPLYLFLIILIIREYKWKAILVLALVGVSVGLADQITSGFMKPFFERFRPSHEPTLAGLVHLVNGYKGGRFGFASSHAANSFAVATFIFLSLRHRHQWLKWLFLWALVVSYSRIYLGVHYPGDIIVGGLIGRGVGWLVYRIKAPVENLIDRLNKLRMN